MFRRGRRIVGDALRRLVSRPLVVRCRPEIVAVTVSVSVCAWSGARAQQPKPTTNYEDDDIPEYVSESKFGWPGKPGLSRVVADNAKEILATKADVLIEFYSPDCPSCERLSPVIRHIAASTRFEDSIIVGQMNVDANHDETFVPSSDLKMLPLIRFFPSDGGPPTDLEERTNVPELLRFIKKNAVRPYNEERVKRESKKLLSKTKKRVRKVVEKQLAEDETMITVKQSPCGELGIEAMCKLLVSLVTSDEIDFSAAEANRNCIKKNEKAIKEYWTQVVWTSEKMLKMINARREDEGLPKTPERRAQ